jgi:hypothetical protein
MRPTRAASAEPRVVASRPMARRNAHLVTAALVGLALLCGGARAEAQSAAAPDVVRLRDGGLLRGTIAEYAVGDHVTIVLITGETRRIAAGELRYAGPAQDEPTAGAATTTGGATAAGQTGDASITRNLDTSATSAATATVAAATAAPAATSAPATTGSLPAAPDDARPMSRIRIRSRDGERVQVDAAPRGAELAPMCETPCAPTLQTGVYRFALTRPGLPRLEAAHLVPLEPDDRVTVTYDTRGGTRTGGLVLIGITAATGVGIALAPLAIEERARDRAIVPALVAGAALAGLGTLVGLLMHGAEDRALVAVTHRDEDDEDDDED